MIRLLLTVVFTAGPAFAAQPPATKDSAKAGPTAKAQPKKPTGYKPTLANVPYGTHPRQVLDFYQAKSDSPTPLIFAIHGGGWVNGSKDGYGGLARRANAAGISLVAINYRMVPALPPLNPTFSCQ